MQPTRAMARLHASLDQLVHTPGSPVYEECLDIWSRSERTPLAVVRCSSTRDVQRTVREARELGLPISVRGGGHDFAGRALCDGLVIDLGGLRRVELDAAQSCASLGGGARVHDVFAVTDGSGFAPVSGAASAVGVAGLTLGGGYGPLIGRFGLACDSLRSAQVVLASGEVVSARDDSELLWALRGGGGNFGIVTSLQIALHKLSSVVAGMLVYPLEQAASVLRQAAAICESAPDALIVQLGMIPGPAGVPCAVIAPTFSEPGTCPALEALLGIGKPLVSDVRLRSYADSCRLFDPYIANGRVTSARTRLLTRFDAEVVNILVEQIERRPSALCSVLTHEFRGAAARVAPDATAFGQRAAHVLLEILAQTEANSGEAELAWTRETADRLERFSLPGAYANMSALDEPERAAHSFGPNGQRLRAAKHHFDPDRVFTSVFGLE